jgi:hypothetical protein
LIKAGAKIDEMEKQLQKSLWGKLAQEKRELLSKNILTNN